jgi:hypothetical protein
MLVKRFSVCVIVVSVAAVLGACGNAGPEPVSYSAVASAVPVQITTVTFPAPTPTGTDTAARVPMPAVVCMNLQAAQDLIQTAGVFYSRSEDATGRGRMQLVDRNWVVVAQTPAPGEPVGEGEAVLAVVEVGEPTDCY